MISNSIKKLIVLCALSIITACSSNPYQYNNEIEDNVKPIIAKSELKDNELLDVAIKIFEPGKLPKDENKKRGLSKEIRESEARFMPLHLKYTMQRTGYWGTVRVVPDESIGSDILINGKIIDSDGENVSVLIKVYDATGKKWLEKTYSDHVEITENIHTEVQKNDKFQNLYNKISNDIIKLRQEQTAKQVQTINRVADIRFAQIMAPEVFAQYLTLKDNIYQVKRLPADNDPMMIRINAIKSRNELMVDTINNYYDLYYDNMWESYENWRKFRSQELESIREIERKATTQKLLGAAAIIGAIALGASHNQSVRNSTGVLRTVMVAGGAYAVYSGFKTSKESEMNKEALKELGDSFSTEIEPSIIEVNGITIELSGSANQQYAKWRGLLKKIYDIETGLE